MKRYTKDATKFAIGSLIVGGMPGTSNISSYMPMMGGLMETSHTVRMLGKTAKQIKKMR